MDKNLYFHFKDLHLSTDFRFAGFSTDYLENNQANWQDAHQQMTALENGAIANPDEGRMVGHYWLRNPSLAPSDEIGRSIEKMIDQVKSWASSVHEGEISSPSGKFTDLLVIGIGGSALGPQFVTKALTRPTGDRLNAHFFDNTDPDGMDKVLAEIGNDLSRTLVVVISKSGGTKETRNGMLEAKNAFEKAGIDFSKHAVAVTGAGSQLDQVAQSEGWVRRFPMWDWVGGRTSELCAVGLLPAALQGIDIQGMLKGAAACDEITRSNHTMENPAALLALMWHYAGKGRGEKDMVLLPYKDRLELFSRYLQQLVMESLGKELDLKGRVVNQGIAVYGNKGSTDQHAYVQQLREGVLNFFVTFIEVLSDRKGDSLDVESGVTTGDYLSGFYLGTREALSEKNRESITITINEVNPFSVGVLIALFERAVGFYASLVGINAYHQPGVEAGKKAAGSVIQLQAQVLDHLAKERSKAFTATQIAAAIGTTESTEWVFKVCEHLSANPGKGITRVAGPNPTDTTYQAA